MVLHKIEDLADLTYVYHYLKFDLGEEIRITISEIVEKSTGNKCNYNVGDIEIRNGYICFGFWDHPIGAEERKVNKGAEVWVDFNRVYDLDSIKGYFNNQKPRDCGDKYYFSI